MKKCKKLIKVTTSIPVIGKELKKYKYAICLDEINCTYIDELIKPNQFYKWQVYKIVTWNNWSVKVSIGNTKPLIESIRNESDEGIVGFYNDVDSDGNPYKVKYQLFKTLKEAKINLAVNAVLNLSKIVEMYQSEVDRLYH